MQTEMNAQWLWCNGRKVFELIFFFFKVETEEIPIMLSVRNLTSLQLFGQTFLGQDKTQMDSRSVLAPDHTLTNKILHSVTKLRRRVTVGYNSLILGNNTGEQEF